ncbi:MAG: hypothetical protein H0X29_05360 [Parachlamydiaceae bacterium]|nr:hypothetical protein [Parachlamydiaceae bacterium]
MPIYINYRSTNDFTNNKDLYVGPSNSFSFPKSKLYSEGGNINVQGSTEKHHVFKKAVAYKNIDLDNVTISGIVKSAWGEIVATTSKLDKLNAFKDISLINSSAANLSSQWGNIAIVESQVDNISAYKNVKLINSTAANLLSEWGNVAVNDSKLDNINAYRDINLTNSSAKELISQWGNINAKETQEGPSKIKISNIQAYRDVNVEGISVDKKIQSEWGNVSARQSKLGDVNAYNNINLTNSSAKDLNSKWGCVTVRQTDGTQRVFSHITSNNELTTENCNAERLTLYVNPDRKAILDITNTNVSGKIVIKVNDSVFKIRNILCNIVSWFNWTFETSNRSSIQSSEPCDYPVKEFSLLIKSKEMPNNIVFKGFEANEITSKLTDEGILISGRKKV